MATYKHAGPYKKLFTKVKKLRQRLDKVMNEDHIDITELSAVRENLEFFEKKLEQNRERKQQKKVELEKMRQEKPQTEVVVEPTQDTTSIEDRTDVETPDSVTSTTEPSPEQNPVVTESVPVEATTEKAADTTVFAFNDAVEPVKGKPGSWGKVIHHNANDDEVYVEWQDGNMKERDGFGAYSTKDLRKKASIKKAEEKQFLAVYNVSKDVTEFNEDSQDWSGERSSHGIIVKDTIPVNSIEEAVAIAQKDSYVVNPFEAFPDEPGRYDTNQTENAEGDPDENGKYLADYSLYIKLYKEASKKTAIKTTKCVKCDKSLPVEDMVENVHGAGYLCKEHAPDWNKDVSKKKAGMIKYPDQELMEGTKFILARSLMTKGGIILEEGTHGIITKIIGDHFYFISDNILHIMNKFDALKLDKKAFKKKAKKECKDDSGTEHAGPIVKYHGKGSGTPEYYCEKHLPSYKKKAGLEPGTKVRVKPTPSGLIDSYPATKNWLNQEMEVELIDYAPNENTLDVLDVKLPDGSVESIYDFNIHDEGDYWVSERESIQLSKLDKKADMYNDTANQLVDYTYRKMAETDPKGFVNFVIGGMAYNDFKSEADIMVRDLREGAMWIQGDSKYEELVKAHEATMTSEAFKTPKMIKISMDMSRLKRAQSTLYAWLAEAEKSSMSEKDAAVDAFHVALELIEKEVDETHLPHSGSKKKAISDPVKELDEFSLAYFEAALWSSNDQTDDQGGEPLDSNYGIIDLSDEFINKSMEEINEFREQAGDLLNEIDDSQAGHDFWLTRNHHGAGFWDRGYEKSIGDSLTDLSQKFGEVYLSIDDMKEQVTHVTDDTVEDTLEKHPTLDVDQTRDTLLEQLNQETDTAKKEQIKKKLDNLRHASKKKLVGSVLIAIKKVARNPEFHLSAEADDLLGSAYRKLTDFKSSIDSFEEIPNSMQPVYDQIMKAMGMVADARQDTNQLREITKKLFNSLYSSKNKDDNTYDPFEVADDIMREPKNRPDFIVNHPNFVEEDRVDSLKPTMSVAMSGEDTGTIYFFSARGGRAYGSALFESEEEFYKLVQKHPGDALMLQSSKKKADNLGNVLPDEEMIDADDMLPIEPTDDDIVIVSEGQLGSETVAYQNGKEIVRSHGDYDEFEDQIRAYMEKQQYWPQVWVQDDHGGLEPISLLGSISLSKLDKKAEEPQGIGYGGDRPGVAIAPKRDEDVSLKGPTTDSTELLLDVANRQWVAKKTSGGVDVPNAYAIFDDNGQQVMVIKMKESQDLNKDQLENIVFNELGKHELVQASEDGKITLISDNIKTAKVVPAGEGKWKVVSETGKNLGGPYESKDKAQDRLRQVEYFKHKEGGNNKVLRFPHREHEPYQDPKYRPPTPEEKEHVEKQYEMLQKKNEPTKEADDSTKYNLDIYPWVSTERKFSGEQLGWIVSINKKTYKIENMDKTKAFREALEKYKENYEMGTEEVEKEAKVTFEVGDKVTTKTPKEGYYSNYGGNSEIIFNPGESGVIIDPKVPKVRKSPGGDFFVLVEFEQHGKPQRVSMDSRDLEKIVDDVEKEAAQPKPTVPAPPGMRYFYDPETDSWELIQSEP